MAPTRAPARIPAHWGDFAMLVEECIDGYVKRHLQKDERAQAIRDGVKAVILDRRPVAEVENGFGEGTDSRKVFLDAMRDCKARLSRVFGPRSPHETLEKTLKLIDEFADDTTFQLLWTKIGMSMLTHRALPRVVQKRRRNGEKAAGESKPKTAKVAAQPNQQAVALADDVVQMPVGNHEAAASHEEELLALKQENDQLRSQNADLKHEIEQLRSQKAADDRKTVELAQKVARLMATV